MRPYINIFLKTEITGLPAMLDRHGGRYFNNTVCNCATWMFCTWYLLHLLFDDSFNALLKRMKWKEYVRIRLKRSLWNLGFYTTVTVYCSTMMLRNHLNFVNVENSCDSNNSQSSQLILEFIVLVTFYLHSAFWEWLKYNHMIAAVSYLCLFSLAWCSYYLSVLEEILRLTILICCTQIALELTRCVTALIKREHCGGMIHPFFLTANIVFISIKLLVVPVWFGYALEERFSSPVILLFILLAWLISELHESVLSKVIMHWLKHEGNKIDKEYCDKDIYECSLFPLRNDATYRLSALKNDMKQRGEKRMSLIKPKNKNVVMQTLKCMVVIKRKLKEKRRHAVNTSHEQIAPFVENAQGCQNNDDKAESFTSNEERNNEVEEVLDGKLEFNVQNNKHSEDNNMICSTKYKKD